jgi:hypothetical protein
MYQDLYEYFILNKQLNIPGIGVIVLERKPSGTDITRRLINAPAYTISYYPGNETPPKKFFFWLADKWGIAYHEAIVRFNNFTFDLKNHILSGKKLTWNEVGTFSKTMTGEVRFEPAMKQHYFDPPVSAVRIIREKAVHNVRVGEQEKTSAEMSAWLHSAGEKEYHWWAPVLIVAILLIIFTGIYFSQKGWSTSSAANQQKLSPQTGSAAYTILR